MTGTLWLAVNLTAALSAQHFGCLDWPEEIEWQNTAGELVTDHDLMRHTHHTSWAGFGADNHIVDSVTVRLVHSHGIGGVLVPGHAAKQTYKATREPVPA